MGEAGVEDGAEVPHTPDSGGAEEAEGGSGGLTLAIESLRVLTSDAFMSKDGAKVRSLCTPIHSPYPCIPPTHPLYAPS